MANVITYNGTASNSLGILIVNSDSEVSAGRNLTKIKVPGRNGDVIIDNGNYNTVKVSYEIGITSYTETNFQKIAKWLTEPTDYAKLSESEKPGIYRMAIFSGDLSATKSALAAKGKATLTFECRPEKFVVTTPATITFQAVDPSNWEATGFSPDSKPIRPRVTIAFNQAPTEPYADLKIWATGWSSALPLLQCRINATGLAKLDEDEMVVDFSTGAVTIAGNPALEEDFDFFAFRTDSFDPNGLTFYLEDGDRGGLGPSGEIYGAYITPNYWVI